MATIKQISPDEFSIQDYTFQDYDIVPNFEVTSIFQPENDSVEYFVYDANNNLLVSDYNFKNYSFTEDPSITNNDGFSTINLTPEQDLIDRNLDVGQYNSVYNFFENQLNSNSESTFYIKELSTDRTELRLASNVVEGVLEAFPSFKEQLEGQDYFNEFYLNFGANQIIIAVNALLDNGELLIKLYEPLPSQFKVKSTCWVVTKIADPVAYNIDLISQIEDIIKTPYLKGPNTNLQIKGEVNNSTNLSSVNDIVTTSLTSSFQQVNSLLSEKGISINVDYTDFNNFVQFSSAEQRLLNFYTKAAQIESYTNELVNYNYSITGSTSSSFYVSESKANFQSKINNIIKNFDGYEYFLYYESSSYAWPKQNTEPPYILFSTGSTEVLDWIGNSDETATGTGSVFPYGPYGGLALSASRYDADNVSNLLYAMPEFVLDDSQNEPYQLFVEMLGQHFDNIWIYLKDVTNKYNADNRLKYGISKDLVAQAIRDFGLKIYQNQFSSDDLYSAFLGITPSGSLLPYTGSELITSYVTASSEVIPLDDVNKSIYKRIYHNMPYLLNKKGTIQGIKALIASYGIPNTILRVSEFGGKDRDNSNDWDYWYNKFGYSFYTSGSNHLRSSFALNSAWGAENDRPGAVEFRFQSEGIPTVNLSQSLWTTDNGIALELQYEGSGSISGSYSGSITDTYNQYGYLKLFPDPANLTVSASVYLPFFNEGWWSVLINSGSAGYDLYAKNKIYIGDDASLIGFQASSSISEVNTLWENSVTSYFGSGSQANFSGSLQEVRYYKTALSESVFDDYVMNQLSIEGNSLNSSPLDLVFRAPLGSELNTGSLESVHPKITGSWEVTQSFALNSNFTFDSTPAFTPGTEYIFLDQPAAGIKNRITDKVRIGEQILPTGSNQVLSQYRSIEQQLPLSQSYTPDVNSIEAAFSPQNEINDDIIEQIGYFNLGEKIGDNRYNFPYYTTFPTSSAEVENGLSYRGRTDYIDLSKLATEYFEKYTSNYDVFDYIRLIKYFDNSLFKMIKDFVPAKSSLSSGVVIKQHLLERSRYPHPQASTQTKTTRVQGTGSAADTTFNYYTQDLGVSGSISIGSFSGGAGGGPNVYNQLANNPYEQSIGTELPFGTPVTNLTQSFTQSLDTIAGIFETIDSKQEEFYNGEYSGSEYVVTNGELSPGCFIYLHGLPDSYEYSASIFNTTSSYVTNDRFINSTLTPMIDGYVYFLGSNTNMSKIRISKTDANGNDLASSLNNLLSISTISELGNKTYTFAGDPTDLGTDYIYTIANSQTQPTYTGNNIMKNSFAVNVAPTGDFNVRPSTAEQFFVNNPFQYTGYTFFPLSETNYSKPITLTDRNTSFPTESVFRSDRGEMIYHYSNDSVLQVAPGMVAGSTPRNVYIPGGYGTNWSGNIQMAMVQVRGGDVADEVKVIWDCGGDWQSITGTPNSFNKLINFVEVSYASLDNELDFIATDDITKYYIGFLTQSVTIPSPGNDSTIRLTSGGGGAGPEISISASQASLELDNQGSIPIILQSSYPAGFQNSDCDVLQGNAVADRVGTLYYDVDYSTNQQTAVNEAAILNGTAERATVQDSNYTLLGQINPRYKGSRTSSPDFNVWDSSSVNTFGQLPTAESDKTYFAYFDFINGTGPELNDKSIAHIQFLVDQDGNTIPPDETKLYITQNTFQTGETVFVNLDDPLRFETPMNKLNGVKQVVRGGQRIDALLYSDSGSSYSGEIQFETGSFSVTDYQFTAKNTNGSSTIPGSDTTVYAYTTGSIGTSGTTFNTETLTNTQYNNTTGVFTFTSDTNSPVKFIAKIDTQFLYTTGAIYFYIVKNWSSGTPTPSQILAQSSYGGSFSSTSNHTFNLDTGFQNFDNGDTVQVVYYSTFITGYLQLMNSKNLDYFQAINQINPEGVITEDYWHVTSSTDIWMTGSLSLSAAYGATQYQSWINYPEFDPIINSFTVQVGDEIRFNGAEAYARMVQDVIYPQGASDGLLKIKLNASMSSAADPQHFLLRRYVNDASYVIIDSTKPLGSTSPGTMRPEYVTDLVENNFAGAVSSIIKSNANK